MSHTSEQAEVAFGEGEAMNAKSIRSVSGVLFALSTGLAVGLALSLWADTTSAHNAPASQIVFSHVLPQSSIYAVSASVPLTTPTPMYTLTPTPSVTPPPNCPDLVANAYWHSACFSPNSLMLITQQTNPNSDPVPPTTMRLLHNDGVYQDFPVPELNPQNNWTYTYNCYA